MSEGEDELASMVIERESEVESYYKLQQTIENLLKERHSFITRYTYILPFLQPGRLVRVSIYCQILKISCWSKFQFRAFCLDKLFLCLLYLQFYVGYMQRIFSWRYFSLEYSWSLHSYHINLEIYPAYNSFVSLAID